MTGPADGTFGPVGGAAAITIHLPAWVAPESVAAPPSIEVHRIRGGVLILAQAPYPDDDTAGDDTTVQLDVTLLSVVDDDGAVRWQRCIGSRDVHVLTPTAAHDHGVALVQIDWSASALNLDDGRTTPIPALADTTVDGGGRVGREPGGDLALLHRWCAEPIDVTDACLVLVDLSDLHTTVVPNRPETAGRHAGDIHDQLLTDGDIVETFINGEPRAARWHDGTWSAAPVPPGLDTWAEWTFDHSGRKVLSGSSLRGDWVRSDIPTFPGWISGASLPDLGATMETVGDVVLARRCPDVDDDGTCHGGSLLGIDATTGETRWELPGDRRLGPAADGRALVADDDGSTALELIDVHTGRTVSDERWDTQFVLSDSYDVPDPFVAGDAIVVPTWGDMDIYLPPALTPATPVEVSLP